MAKIGTLTADLKLESAAFIRDLRKASQETARATTAMQRSMSGLQRGFAAAGAQLKIFLAGFVGIQGIRALSNLATQAIRTGDEIGEAATKIGVGSEVLQRFRLAAAQADVETEQLDTALRMFAQNLAQGKIKAEGNSITEAFRNYIQTIAEAPTQLEKVRIAQAAFSKQWQTAMLLAAQGSEEFNRQADAAFVISEQAIENASKLDNELRALSSASEAGFDTGFLEAFNDGLGTTKQELQAINEAARLAGSAIGTTFSVGVEGVRALMGAWEAARGLYDGLPEGLKVALGFVLAPRASTRQLLAGDQISGAAGGDLPSGKMDDFLGSIENVNTALGEGVGKIDAWKTKVTEAVDELASLKETFNQFGSTISSSFASAIVEAKDLKETLAELAKDLARIALNNLFMQLIGNTGTGVAGTGGSGLLGSLFHEGGIVGMGGGRSRMLPAPVFRDAPRFHNGLMPDEFPSILKRGEGVFTKEQMKAMGGGGSVNAPVTVNLDARGADRDAVLAAVARLEKSLPTIIVTTVKDARSRKRL